MGKNENKREKNLLELLKRGVSPYAAVEETGRQLEEAGFQRLYFDREWKLAQGGKYYFNHHGSAVAAFVMPTGSVQKIRIAAAHTDYPCLRIKTNPDIINSGYRQINVEVYGGMILNTWLDRPLGISGRIALKGKDAFHPEYVTYTSTRPLLVVPNLAIHMNREVNKGVELNKQTDLTPVFGLTEDKEEVKGALHSFLAEELQVEKDKILSFDLTLFCTENPEILGLHEEFISSPRLDNLTSLQAVTEAVKEAETAEGTLILGVGFDHEEIGSRTKKGAASMFLREVLDRICVSAGISEEERMKLYYSGTMLSVDVAHGLHPNQMSKMDVTNKPVLGHGVCLKEAAAQSYATDCGMSAVIKELCKEHGIPLQVFVNRSDQPGGGTLGAVAASFLPMQIADIGIPILAMHSARELMGREDEEALTKLIKAFYTA